MIETRGRPRKGPGGALTKVIGIKMTPSKKKIFEMEAERCGKALSEFMRGALFALVQKNEDQTGKNQTDEDQADENEANGNGTDGNEVPTIDNIYSTPVPEDFHELLSLLEKSRAEARSAGDPAELERALETLRDRLGEHVQDYRERLQRRKRVRDEDDAEVRSDYGREKRTEQVSMRVRPKGYEWLEEMRRRRSSVVGLSSWIRCEVTLWVINNEIFDCMIRDLPRRVEDIGEILSAGRPSEMREEILKLADSLERKLRAETREELDEVLSSPGRKASSE